MIRVTPAAVAICATTSTCDTNINPVGGGDNYDDDDYDNKSKAVLLHAMEAHVGREV
jgi:hypothetical protein